MEGKNDEEGKNWDYVPAGEQVWVRQNEMRVLKREADHLADMQKIQYEKLLAETIVDRELCEAAFELGFIDHVVELTLEQKEVAEDIRLQAERLGIPWKGLAVEEMMEILKENAEGKRQDLLKFLLHSNELKEKAEHLMSVATNRGALLDGVRDETIQRILDFTEKLIETLRRRSDELVETTRATASERAKTLKSGLARATSQKEKLVELIKRGNDMKAMDDLGLLNDLFKERAEMDETAISIDTTLESIEEEQAVDSVQGSQENKQETKKETKFEGDEEDDVGGFVAPKIDFRYDPLLLRRLALYGTIGRPENIKPQVLDQPMLQWCEARSDIDWLGFSDDRTTATHQADGDRRVILFGKNGFAKGTAVLRVMVSGLEPTQWIAVGIASAAEINTSSMIRDSVILEVPEDGEHNQTTIDASSSYVRNGSTMTIVLNCESRTVEYYKAGIRIKVAVLEFGQVPVDSKVHFYPYATLFHPNQTISLIT